MRGQQLDQKKLQFEEDACLVSLRRDCSDEDCIHRKYEKRIAALRDQSLRVASPSVYEETRPFPVASILMARAQALVGQNCSYQQNMVGAIIADFESAPGFLPVISSDGMITVREKGGARFADSEF
jgi:uncharacterized protein